MTQGYATKQECDKWPKQVCELTKENVKKFSPETQVHSSLEADINHNILLFISWSKWIECHMIWADHRTE